MYLEELSKNNPSNSEGHNITMNVLLEFWGKTTPCILQLVSYSKVVSSIKAVRDDSIRKGKTLIIFHGIFAAYSWQKQ